MCPGRASPCGNSSNNRACHLNSKVIQFHIMRCLLCGHFLAFCAFLCHLSAKDSGGLLFVKNMKIMTIQMVRFGPGFLINTLFRCIYLGTWNRLLTTTANQSYHVAGWKHRAECLLFSTYSRVIIMGSLILPVYQL